MVAKGRMQVDAMSSLHILADTTSSDSVRFEYVRGSLLFNSYSFILQAREGTISLRDTLADHPSKERYSYGAPREWESKPQEYRRCLRTCHDNYM